MDALPVRRPRSHRWRLLTAGEIAMASLLFRDAIDYSRVRIHRRRYMPFQPKNCAMTPNGSMYFHHSCFLDDYAQASLTGQHWFLHEMVHVWQHQLGYPVRLRGALRQQRYRNSLALYESVLAGFLADPGSRANLHRGLARRLVRAPV